MAEQKSVVVTGASTGIGYGIARVLGQRGIHVFCGVRKQGDADRLARELGAPFTPLLMDVTDEAGVMRLRRWLRGSLAAAHSSA